MAFHPLPGYQRREQSPLLGEQTFSGGAFYFGAILVALFFMFLVAGATAAVAAVGHYGFGGVFAGEMAAP